ncbi:MAG: 4'-phosphopantetheinyl transferase family protein [Hyphomicrobiaceae bacterium]
MTTGATPSALEIWSVDLDRAAAALAAVSAELSMTLPPATRAYDPHRLTAHQALRLLLAARVGLVGALAPFRIGERGKPYLADGGLEFSLAHSGGRALIALSDVAPGGVDIEARRRMTMSAPRRAAIERAAIQIAGGRELAQSAGDERTLQAWVRLEAAAKASGEGIGSLLERLRARPGWWQDNVSAPDAPVTAIESAVANRPFAMAIDLTLTQGYIGAIAGFGLGRQCSEFPCVVDLPTDPLGLRAIVGPLAV